MKYTLFTGERSWLNVPRRQAILDRPGDGAQFGLPEPDGTKGREAKLPSQNVFFCLFFLRCAAIGAAEKVEEGIGSPETLQSAEAKRHVGSPLRELAVQEKRR